MRYARILAVFTVFALAVESIFAQQAVFSPLIPNDYAPLYLAGDPVAKITAPQKTSDEVIACKYVPESIASCDTCAASCGDSCYKGCCYGRVFCTLDYLFWQATRDATPYAGTLRRPSGSSHGLPIDSGTSLVSQLRNAGYDRDGGFRANIGYMMNDCWDIGFRYTYFHTSGFSSLGDASVDSNSVLANRLDRNMADDILDVSFDDGEVDFASQRLQLNFNTYDIEIRRKLRLRSQRLAVGVMGGFRFAEINQGSQISYQSIEGGNLLSADTDESMGMSAAGLLVGGEAHYFLGWSTSIFARGSVSLLYANFDVSRTDLQLSATEAGVRSIRDSFQNVVPVLDLNVGLRWQRGRFHVACGYDMAHWFEMVQGIEAANQEDVDGTTNSYRIERGGLSFEGFFVEGGMRF